MEKSRKKLPVGWEMKKLGEVLSLEYGKPLDKGKRSFDGLYPVYGANGAIDRTNEYYCNEKSIIVGRKGSAGEINYTEEKFWPLDVTYFIKFDKQSYNLDFLFYLFRQLDLTQFAKGVKPGINRNDVYQIKVAIPLLPEQQRIVAKLDEVFAEIAAAQANIERNLQNCKKVFQSELNAVFANKWEKREYKTLEQISKTFGRGKSKHRPRNDKKLYGGDYPFIQTGDIRNCDHLIIQYSQTYSELGLAQSKLWPAGTICITIAANIAETGILTFDACFPDSVIGLVVNEDLADRYFVEYLLQFFKAKLQALGKGSAQANINMGTFENELFPIPTLSEQQHIVETLDTLSAECKQLEVNYQQKLSSLEELKKSILQKAFSGELI